MTDDIQILRRALDKAKREYDRGLPDESVPPTECWVEIEQGWYALEDLEAEIERLRAALGE